MATSNRRDSKGVRKQEYRRFKEGVDYEPLDAEGQETAAMIDMMRRGFLQTEEIETDTGETVERKRKRGKPPKLETLEEFEGVVLDYMDYIEEWGRKGGRLIPDVEGFCLFAGICRETLNEWEHTRSRAYADAIKRLKNGIAAYKKQLALYGKIPPIVFATDFNNNHGYIQQHNVEVSAVNRLEALPTAEDIRRRLPVVDSNIVDTDIDIDIKEI